MNDYTTVHLLIIRSNRFSKNKIYNLKEGIHFKIKDESSSLQKKFKTNDFHHNSMID